MKEQGLGPIILDVQGLTLLQEEQEILAHPNVGGVIFFSRNYENPEQLSELVQHIKSIRPYCVLCVDQEGGRVQRFLKGFTTLPGLSVLGDLIKKNVHLAHVVSLSEQLGILMALEVRSVGVDLSFAPVLDLDQGLSAVLRGRAFHNDPEIVSQLAGAYVKGMAKVGMKATGKHFPGHGSVQLDSHLTLPEDLRSMSEITPDLTPFRYLIKQGIAAIMPAHIIYPTINKYPVCFSPYWLKEVLRHQLQFTGAIISDDLSMQGAAGMGDYQARAQAALEAGCDLVLICNNRGGAIAALEGLIQKEETESQKNRFGLLSQGDSPCWRTLRKTELWNRAFSSVAELGLERVC